MISDILLMRLRDCAASTRLGMADKGMPLDLAHLSRLGLTTACEGGGYKVTDEGLAYLKTPESRTALKTL